MNDPTYYLKPQEGGATVLSDSVFELFRTHLVAKASADTLILQPPFTNSLLTTLPEDQALAASHASQFKAGGGFGVVGAFLAGLGSLSHFVKTLCAASLSSVAKDLDTLDPKGQAFAQALTNFRTLIGAITDTCCVADQDSGSTLSQMNETLQSLVQLAGDIDDDNTRLQTAIGEVDEDGVIAELESSQADLQGQFAEVNGEIAKGATTTIASDIAFGFSFAKEFMEGVSAGAIIGAAVGVVGEADAIQQFNTEQQALYDKQTRIGQQISALADTIAEDKTDSMTLTLTAAQIRAFNAQIDAINGAAGSVIQQMIDWRSQLEDLSTLESPPSEGYFEDQVKAGSEFWTGLHTQVRRYSSILAYTLPARTPSPKLSLVH